MRLIAKTFRGLEDVLRDELIDLGAKDVEIGNRMVSFEGDLEMMYRANFCCRTALRILKPIIQFRAGDTDELYDKVRDLEWEQYMSPSSTFSIDTTAFGPIFTHTKYATYRVKDAIVDHFADRSGKRPSVRLNGADLIFNVHIDDDRVTISLDSSGAPLNQRGYRTETGNAPINEVLAAGIILKTGWRGDSNFVDPMCGSGTFLIEAALIATGVYPGVYRKHYAFEKWNDFDAEAFARVSEDDSTECDFEYKIYGSDINPEMVMIARANIQEAHLEPYIELKCEDFLERTESAPKPGILITNPPYGERLKPEKIGDLYHGIGSTLKRCFAGYNAWILGYHDEHFASIGLKPSVKFPVLNGSLECSLREYVLFDGSMNDFKIAGGTTENKKFNRTVKPHVKRLSDNEWERRADRERAIEPSAESGDRPRRPRKEEPRKRFDRKPGNSAQKRHGDRFDDKRGEKRPFKGRDAIEPRMKKPRISADNAVVFDNGPRLRSRRGWKKTNDDNEQKSDNQQES